MESKMKLEVAIVGAGFSGMAAAARLKKEGCESFVILEKADEVGGTWRDNTYPGCACDVKSNLYSYSFAPRSDWSRLYASQPEILQYLKDCSSDLNLRQHIRFNSAVNRAEFDADSGYWSIHIKSGGMIEARVLVMAVGPLNRPSIPEIPGLENFSGPVFHSAQWDHSVDLKNKRVAVVGTGASAIQVVPGITAASGCAAYAGIPLTHRDHAQSVRFVTGHRKDGSVDLDWAGLMAPSETLVFYMGLVGLRQICARLIEHGRDPATPIALVSRGTTDLQAVITGTLADLPDTIEGREIHAPTLIIVGSVVSLHPRYRWFH